LISIQKNFFFFIAVAKPRNEQKQSLDNFTAYQRALIIGTIPDDNDEKNDCSESKDQCKIYS
jgi:hypothetical protein